MKALHTSCLLSSFFILHASQSWHLALGTLTIHKKSMNDKRFRRKKQKYHQTKFAVFFLACCCSISFIPLVHQMQLKLSKVISSPRRARSYISTITSTITTTSTGSLNTSNINNNSNSNINSRGSYFVAHAFSIPPATHKITYKAATPSARLFATSIPNPDKTTPAADQDKESSERYTIPDPIKLASLMPERDPKGRPYTLYEKCVRRLYLTNLFHPVKLGLQNMEEIHAALGNPMDDPKILLVHVAGTNGKGSTSLKIAKSLELAGLKVGLFVSPHVASFRERMQVNGDLISEKEVEDYLPLIYDICEKGKIPATFFEVTTALAFQFFHERNVDAVVLETGLGGRLDATNVVQKPDLAVITSIGLEHTRILGDTIELIAREKAGIIKHGVPVLVGPHCPHDTIQACAVEKGASKYYVCSDVLEAGEIQRNQSEDGESLDYDIENAMIARAALKILEMSGKGGKFPIAEEILSRGVGHRPPCRFEEMSIPGPATGKPIKVILDVAHNPDAMAHLVKKLQATYPTMKEKTRIVVGFSADKDLKLCGSALLDYVSDASKLHLVEAAHPRAAKLEDMLEAEPALRSSNFDEENRSITAQVENALRLAEEKDEMLIVCGSVFLMAEAREAIGIDEPRDSQYIAEVAGANLRHGQEFFADQDPEKK